VALRGFYFSKISPNWPKECEDSDEFSLKLLILLSKKEKLENGWEDFVKKCFNSLSPAFKFQISYDQNDFKNSAKLKSKIKHFLSSENLPKVIKIYEVREEKQKNKKWENAFISAMKLGFDKKDRIKIFRQNKEILEDINKSKKSFLADILKIIIAIRVDNQAWAKKEIRDFLNMGPAEMIFFHQIGRNQDIRNITELFRQFLDKLYTFLADEKWKKMFFNQLHILSNTSEVALDLTNWNANWSFQEIQEEFQSPNYGAPYLGFWYEMYNYNTFPAQVDRFMREQLTSDGIASWGENYFWLFSYYFPEDENAQKQALKIIDKIANSKEMYHKYLILRLLENLNETKNYKILNKIKKSYPELSRPLFQQKRKFYLELLSQGEVLYFSIYQLLKLKDIVVEKDILWWATF